MIARARTQEDLGFREVLAALASRCRTPLGRERATARPFLPDAAAVQASLREIEEARGLHRRELTLPLADVADLRSHLERAGKGGLLEPKELLLTARALTALGRVRDLLHGVSEEAPSLWAHGSQLPALGDLATAIERVFDPSGEISDHASPALREARERARGFHRRIKGELDRLLHDERFLPNLREAYYSVRHDRYVLPVLAQKRAEVPGIVHNASQSGQTLFIEPQGMIGLGNDLAIAQSLVLEEERRILLELSERIGRHGDRILAGLRASALLDEIEAAAFTAEAMDAASPNLAKATAPLDLRGLRHPLLALRKSQVVANDVSLEEAKRALVISGPNAGGKTVTLTGVGLSALMLAAGLPIPVDRSSQMPLFQSVHSAVGDAQDLAQDLSTFSAHLLALRQIAEEASSGALVLIDEIAADTDPRQGAAIAIAVLEDLLARGASVLVTTHLEELKALAHLDARFANARVGFDAAKMAPTYRLQLGVAGSSSAIEIAERMGLPQALCARARELVRSSGGPLAQALAAAEDERRALSEELERARLATVHAEQDRQVAKLAREEAKGLKRALELGRLEALQEELDAAKSEVKRVLEKLRAAPTPQAATEAKELIAVQQAMVEERLKTARLERVRAEEPEAELKVGGMARHLGLNTEVRVLELFDQEAIVAAGSLKLRTKRSDLAATSKTAPLSSFPVDPRKKKERALARAEKTAAAPVPATHSRCDVRGMRADDALREVEGFLDQALRRGDETALILHGHGTGALKQVIRDYLDSSPYVRMFRPGEGQEGGDAVTVVAFRGD